MNDILVRVGADISNFSKGMSDASKQAEQMGRATEKGTLTIGKLVAAVGGVKLLSAGFDMVRNSIGKAFQRIDTMEQFDRVMTTMTGSSEKAAQVLDEVNDAVVGTAYGLDVAAKSTQQFVTSGMDVDKATESISTWGDAVAFYGDGSNETFASVTDALAKMTGKGKVQMDTMNRLVEAGIPAMEIYADATGQSTEQVAEQMQKGELDAEKFMNVMNDALANGTESFEGIEGAAKDAGASWGAAFDNMGAAVARGVTSIIESIDEMLTNNGLPTMRDMVAEFGSFFEETLNKIADNIPKVISAIGEWRDALKPIEPLIMGVVTSIGVLLAAAAAFGTIRGMITLLTTSVGLLGRSFGLATAPMFAIIAVLALVGAAVYELWQTNEEFRQNVQIIWEHVQQIFSMVLETISGAIVAFIGVLMELIYAMMPVVSYVAEVAASFLGWIVTMMETHSWVANVVAIVAALFGALAVGIPIVAGIIKVFTIVWTVLKTVWTVVTFVAKVFRILFTVVRVVAVIFGAFLSPLGLVITIATAVGGTIMWLGDKFEWIGGIIDTVSGWISDAWGGVLDFLGIGTKEAADEAGQSIEGLSDSAEASTGKMEAEVAGNIGNMTDNVTEKIAGMSTDGSNQISNLHVAGAGELAGLATDGTASAGDLSAGTQDFMSQMSDGSIESVSGMNTDITSMLSDLESSGSIDMESLNANVTGDIGDMSSMSLDEISELTSGGSADFSGLESDMTSSASSMESDVTSSFSGMSDSIESEMSNIESATSSSLDGLASNFKSSMSDISSAINSSMQEAAQATQKGMQSVSKAATQGMQQTSRSIQQGTSRMNTDVARSITQMQRAYTQGFTQIRSITTSNMNQIVNASRSGMSSVNAAFSSGMSRNASISLSTGNQIVSIFNRLQSQLRSAGVNAMTGLQAGLNSRSGGVMGTARRIANNVASTMRKALKVHSPSRITRAIGGFTGEGLEIGLIRSQSAVLKAANGLAEAAKPNVDMSYATPNGAYGTMASAVRGAVSVNASSKDRALVGAINDLRRDLTNLRVEMEGETVGRIARPHINEGNAKDELGRYFG